MAAPQPPPLTLVLEVDDARAWALAQLVKRFGFDDAERLSVDRADAEMMIGAVIALQKALDKAGYSPR